MKHTATKPTCSLVLFSKASRKLNADGRSRYAAASSPTSNHIILVVVVCVVVCVVTSPLPLIRRSEID